MPLGVLDGGWGWGASFLDGNNDGTLDVAMTGGFSMPFVADLIMRKPMRYWLGTTPVTNNNEKEIRKYKRNTTKERQKKEKS